LVTVVMESVKGDCRNKSARSNFVYSNNSLVEQYLVAKNIGCNHS